MYPLYGTWLPATLAAALAAGSASARGADASRPSNVRLPEGEAATAVADAVAGAARRLESPACRLVLADFRDHAGRPLSAALAESGLSAAEFLGRVLFYDGSSHLACARGRRLAFTQPGSRAVYVCGPLFLRKRRRDPDRSEAIVIHELLHSLGLGENPPSSAAITRRVEARCEPSAQRRAGSGRASP